MSTSITDMKVKRVGGSFLIEDHSVAETYTPEDLTPEHLAIKRAAKEFFDKEVVPNLDAIVAGDRDLAVSLVRNGAELGLTAVLVPEEYGGMELDLASSMVVSEEIGRDGNFGGWIGAHSGIGTLPLLLFGTEAQKKKYLPRLSTAELIGAYALTEPHCGSDSLAAKTRADLSEDGTHYVLNGTKMWITNGGVADLFTVFAKVNGEQFSAFLVERAFGGVTSGKEEHKMGIKGSSTTAVYLDNVKVPVENLLGEIGRGHIIAFNILNLGRLKLGPSTLGGAKFVLRTSIAYAKQRKAFGAEIAKLGMIKHKLAEMAIRIEATGLLVRKAAWNLERGIRNPIVSAYAKAYGADAAMQSALDAVQIFGGNGYVKEYPVEKLMRDAKLLQIYEGTAQIQRVVIARHLIGG